MSAGKGINHSEYNNGSKNLRFIQLWIEPNAKNTIPEYQELKFDLALRENKIAHIVGSMDSLAPIKIKQNCDIYITNLEQGNHVKLDNSLDKYSYYIV
jgi:redox-sensitive bicupin YhaK (pirin superfamily)